MYGSLTSVFFISTWQVDISTLVSRAVLDIGINSKKEIEILDGEC